MPKLSPSWSDGALGRLRVAGYRVGTARAIVVEFLDEQDCCVAAQTIHDELEARGRMVGLASVYRVLDTLLEHGLVQRVDIGDGVARFEPVRSISDHHHHLVCGECGKVEAFSDKALETAIRRVEERSGYDVVAHDVVLRGACTTCR